MTGVRVMTVDDQEVFRNAARAMVTSTPGFDLVAEATSGAEALCLASEARPELVLLDVRMPELDGIETASLLTSAHPGLVVVLVSGYELDDVRAASERSGAVALVQKERLRPGLLRQLWASHGRKKSQIHTKRS